MVMRNSQANQSTKMLSNQAQIFEKITRFFENAESDILVYCDARTFTITTDIKLLQSLKEAARKRGVKLRYISEITQENLAFAKKQMDMVDELRHLDGVRGNFMLSDCEFMVSPEVSKRYPLTDSIYSNLDNMLRQYRYLFETLWNHAVPAQERIRELEEAESETSSRQSRAMEKVKEKAVIDRFYVCQECNGIFIYQEDFEEHRITTGHKNIKEYPL